jgi:hypothetical protein
MNPVCHRCGTTLNSPDELFCQHCGAPQLRYEPSEDTGTSFVSAQQTASARGFEDISWKAAIASAILVAVPVALLSTMLDFSSLWVIGGGIATVSLYRRRVGIPPTSRMGWRIGGLLGILAAFISAAIYSLKLLVERYALHNGELDQQVHSFAQQFGEQINHSDPQTAAAMMQLAHFWVSPDGTAAIVLGGAAVTAVFTVIFAAAGGAIGARIASLGNRAHRSS